MISHIMTLANGIIGVSVLAMPFCFKQCGIILATLVLLLSSILSRLSCYFLIKSAVMSRRRNFEFLAFHAFGPMGKFLVELCIIGFLLGTCIAFFVVVGDLGPQIVGELFNRSPEDIRTSFLITTGVFIVLPLGLLRNIDSLASVSTASIAFYICLVLKVISDSTHHIFAADWLDKIHYWRPGGILQCLPIFALALFCQTQLFEIYEAMPNAALERMNQVVRGALNICTLLYLCMGFFGYIAFCTQSFTGNILMSFEPSLTSEIIKIGFVLSVAFSFPLVIFPCRASLNSLLFKRGYTYETSTSYISETKFRCLTILIVIIALTVGVLIPSIEFVLGIVGSTIGVIICLIFPAACFISISTKNTNERLLAQLIIFIGIWIMVLGTYANLYAMEESSNLRLTPTTSKVPNQVNNLPNILVNNEIINREEIKNSDTLLNIKDDVNGHKLKIPDKPDNENVRQEPPVPVERLPETENLKDQQEVVHLNPVTISPKIQEIVDEINNIDGKLIKEANEAYHLLKKNKEVDELKQNVNIVPLKQENKNSNIQKNDIIAVDAIKKEESELAADKEMLNVNSVQTREELKKTLEKHIMEQKEMLQEQRKLLKDIDERKKELQLANKVESDQNIEKYNHENVNIDVSLKNSMLHDETNKEKLEPKKLKNELKNGLHSTEKYIILSNVEKNELLSNLKKADNIGNIENNQNLENRENIHGNENIKNNEITNDLNKKPIDIISSNYADVKVINNNVSQKLNHKNVDPSIRQFDDPIIKVLTKKSNKIENDSDGIINESKHNNNYKTLTETKKVDNKQDHKNKEYAIPIVLKMNNQTKQISESEHLEINQSNVDIAAVRRDILEHQREKRMIETKKKIHSIQTAFKYKDNKTLEKTLLPKIKTEEICIKTDGNLENTKQRNKLEAEKLLDNSNTQNLIKTSVHLSEENVVKQFSIDPDLTAIGNFMQVKKGDLRTLKIDNGNGK